MKELLTEEITSEMDILSKMPIGTTDYTAAVNGVTKLVEKVVELEKFEAEKNDKLETQKKQEELQRAQIEKIEMERQDRLDLQSKQLELQQKQLDLQEKQHKQNVKNTTMQILLAVGTTIFTAAVTIWGTKTTLEFEKEGTVTTSAGRSFLGQLFNKR